MITEEQLAIYQSFNGDDDMWGRCGGSKSDIINQSDWILIRDMLSELTLVKSKLATPEYESRILKKLAEISATVEVSNALLELA